MEPSQPTPPLSSVVPTQSFTPSEQNPIVIHPKHHPILGGIALVVALSLSIFGGKLLFANYWAGSADDVYVVSQTQRPSPSPTSSVPADWKTYNSQGISNFTFKYPDTLTVQVSEEVLGGKPLYQWFPNNRLSTDEFRLQLVAHEVDRESAEIQNPVVYQTSINGTLAEVQKGHTLEAGQDKPDTGLSWRVYFTKNGRPFDFWFYSKSGTDRTDVVNQVLSTFKFTK